VRPSLTNVNPVDVAMKWLGRLMTSGAALLLTAGGATAASPPADGAWVGADYEQYDFHPASAGNPALRDRVGAIFLGRVATTGPGQFPFAIEGQFETGNSDFWVRGRTGVKFGQWTVGPEAIMLGNVAFDELRLGGFLAYDLARNMSVQANIGYADGIATTIRGAAETAFTAA
jgi:hypothetical protein